MTDRPRLFVLIGLPAAGKTTRARRLEREHAALRLTPDEWMIPLFGDNDADGKRDVLEGRLITVALRVLELGRDVVLDFGVWTRDERSALLALAAEVGAETVRVYLPISAETQQQRIAHRWAEAPHTTFPISPSDLQSYREVFEAPDAVELTGHALDDPPGHATWADWAQKRWPSLEVRRP